MHAARHARAQPPHLPGGARPPRGRGPCRGGGGASSAGGRLSKQASTQQRAIEKFMALPSRATEGGEGGGGGAGAGAGAGGDGSHIAHDGDAKFTKVAAELEGRIVNRAVA